MSCGAEDEANDILTSLLVGEDVALPPIDFNDDIFEIPPAIMAAIKNGIHPVTNNELTTTQINGSGTFDILMRAQKAHLAVEFEKGRITGAEYTKAYIALVEGAMSNSVSFLLQKDQAFWQSQAAQLQALAARMQFETTKMQLATAKFEALRAKADYGLTKMKLSTESQNYCIGQYTLEQMMPLQKLQLTAQNILLTKQAEAADKQIATAAWTLTEMLPTQKAMVLEQIESQRAQTTDTRKDGLPITGLLGKQKDLYTQQITSYKRDAEVKAAKMFVDAWITMKTIDEGVLPPVSFQNAQLDVILSKLIDINELGQDLTP